MIEQLIAIYLRVNLDRLIYIHGNCTEWHPSFSHGTAKQMWCVNLSEEQHYKRGRSLP